MKTVRKSVLIWYSAEEMFSLVTDIPSYPRFLPWCDHAAVLSTTGDGVTAEVGMLFGGMAQKFVTRNRHRAPHSVHMELVSGPFSRLDGQWNFVSVGDGSARACRVEFHLRYGFDNAALARLVGPVFDRIADSLVDAFVRRAEQVYGDT